MTFISKINLYKITKIIEKDCLCKTYIYLNHKISSVSYIKYYQ